MSLPATNRRSASRSPDRNRIDPPRRSGESQAGRVWMGSAITSAPPTRDWDGEWLVKCENGSDVSVAAIKGYDAGYRLYETSLSNVNGHAAGWDFINNGEPDDRTYTGTHELRMEWREWAKRGWLEADKRFRTTVRAYPAAKPR